jgi:hypothetical protein
MTRNWKLVSQSLFSILAIFVVVLMIGTAQQAHAQACSAQNWTASTPNIWASGPSVKVMLSNDATTNQPTIPTFSDDGNFNPWGWSARPQTIAELNSVWSCPSGSPVIAVAGAGRETVSFQVFISAGKGTGAALSDVNVTVSPLTGAGTTLTSDNTNNSNVNRYLEGYLPYSGVNVNLPAQLQANGQMPDPLIPFYDPYDSGNPAVATPFNVQAGNTQGVWVNISIPAGQAAGAYSGTVTVSGNGIGTVSIPVNLTVWNGTLPAFDEGSINSSYADMLKAWFPMYGENLVKGDGLNCSGNLQDCTNAISNIEQYQVMAHNYDADAQVDGLGPDISGCYPSGTNTCTSFTTNGTTSSINWTNYDAMVGPALKPGGLFSDGTYMRFFDSPLSNAGAGAWTGGGWTWYNWQGTGTSLPPAGLLQLVNNYVTQISQHFAANHSGSAGWGLPELTSYTFDETYNAGHSKDLGGTPVIYQQIAQYNQAINCANAGQPYNCTGSLGTWSASAQPVHNFLTDEPPCKEDGDDTPYTNSVCADHINLSYPGAANSTAGFPNGQVNIWSPNPFVFTPGQPGPALAYGYGTTLVAGTGYKYTLDLTQGVPALSALPVPIERWFYQGGSPASAGDTISESGVGQRINFWIAYKYGLDETVASTGDPSPASPVPGGVWVFTSNMYGGTPSNCTAAGAGSYSNTSPYIDGAGGDGQLLFPGNQIGCYYTNNTVGEAVLTKSPSVNTGCTSKGYSTCNGISGPVASIRMEAWRRGYQDYEYLYLLGKQSGRSAAMAVINTLGGAGITAGGDGTTSWQALNWQNVDSDNYITGVEPITAAYTGNCKDSTAGLGGLAGGLPNGPLGMTDAGSGLNYNACPGEWTNNPYRIEAARVQLAQDLGWTSSNPLAATPTFSPAAGTYTSAQTVTISDSTSGATIYYTTDGSTPTTSSAVYSGPISVSTTETVKAIATASGYSQSAVGSAAYTINLPAAATPTFSPAAGTYTSAQTVTISDSTSGATIYYTTDGSTPTTSSTKYTSAISVSATETVKAIATASGYSTSAVGSAAYTINLPAAATPTFSPAAGTYTSAQTVTISDSTSGATIYYTTNGSTPTTSSAVYSGPISVSTTETVKAIATASGYSTSAVGSAAYTINLPTVATPTFSPAAGTYTSAQTVTISDSTSGATIYYTTNGSTPTTSSPVYSGPITVSTSETVEALGVKSGYTNSAVGSASYTISSGGGSAYPVIDAFNQSGIYLSSNWTNTLIGPDMGYPYTPLVRSSSSTVIPFLPAYKAYGNASYTGIGFTQAQYAQVKFVNAPKSGSTNNTGPCVGLDTLSRGYCYSGDAGAIINWDYTQGSTVTSSCPVPSAGDTIRLSAQGTTLTCEDVTTGVSASATVQYAPVGNPGMIVDQMNSGTDVVSNFQADCIPTCSGTTAPAAMPTFSPVGGSYASAQSVAITSGTSGATIYYTTDGSAPTTSSTVYSGPVNLSATTTLRAMATATGYSQSIPSVGTTYTFGQTQAAAPTFSLAGGTYTGTQTVTISSTGSDIFFTTDGSTPQVGSSRFSLGSVTLTVSSSETIKAMTWNSGNSNSNVSSATYTIQ